MISVVIPAFNEEENIAQCLVSLCHQTVPRNEYRDHRRRRRIKGCHLRHRAEICGPGLHPDQQKSRRGPERWRECGEGRDHRDNGCGLHPPAHLGQADRRGFQEPRAGAVCTARSYPIEEGLRNRFSLLLANTFSRIGYYSQTFYYTLGCNTAFRKEAFLNAGMYRCIDAGDDLEIAMRLKDLGSIKFDERLKVGFSMRRYKQFGTIQSLYEWVSIVSDGGESGKYSYTQKKYK